MHAAQLGQDDPRDIAEVMSEDPISCPRPRHFVGFKMHAEEVSQGGVAYVERRSFVPKIFIPFRLRAVVTRACALNHVPG